MCTAFGLTATLVTVLEDGAAPADGAVVAAVPPELLGAPLAAGPAEVAGAAAALVVAALLPAALDVAPVAVEVLEPLQAEMRTTLLRAHKDTSWRWVLLRDRGAGMDSTFRRRGPRTRQGNRKKSYDAARRARGTGCTTDATWGATLGAVAYAPLGLLARGRASSAFAALQSSVQCILLRCKSTRGTIR